MAANFLKFLLVSSVLGTCKCLLEGVEGVIQCACSTTECRREDTDNCHAKTFCYVQIIPPLESNNRQPMGGVLERHGVTTDNEDVDAVRGCIDETTPLLCENRRPLSYVDTWPVLLCCRFDWCNRDVLPTLPAWVSDSRDVRLVDNKKHRVLARNTSLRHSDVDQSDHADTDDYYHEPDESSRLHHKHPRLPLHRRQIGYASRRYEEATKSTTSAKHGGLRPSPTRFSESNDTSSWSVSVTDVSHRGQMFLIGLTIGCVLVSIAAAIALVVGTRSHCQHGRECPNMQRRQLQIIVDR